jgi:hypothetical protein
MKTLLLAALLGAALPLAAQNAVDETIPTPGAVTATPSAEDAQFWLMRWTPVEGAKYYRIWREVLVDHDLNAQGELVPLAQPESKWIPWSKVEALSGTSPVQAQIASLDNVNTRWAVSAVVEKEGVELQSPLAIAVDPATAVEVLGWGAVKALGRR